jgi:hypothetical protein
MEAGSMRRRAAKVDISQPGIVKALRDAGCTVVSLAPLGNGVPDLLVGWTINDPFAVDDRDDEVVITRKGAVVAIMASRELADEFVSVLNHRAAIIECKTDNHRLRSNQRDFVREWKGRPVHVVCTPEEALEVLGLRKGEMMDTNNNRPRDLAELDEWCAKEIETYRQMGEFIDCSVEIAAMERVREQIRSFLLRFA